MWFHLARLLGKSVRQAQQAIDAAEFAEWIAYNQIHPFIEPSAEQMKDPHAPDNKTWISNPVAMEAAARARYGTN